MTDETIERALGRVEGKLDEHTEQDNRNFERLFDQGIRIERGLAALQESHTNVKASAISAGRRSATTWGSIVAAVLLGAVEAAKAFGVF